MSDLRSRALAALIEAGPRASFTVQTLAAELETDPHRLSGVLHRLREDGLVKRVGTKPTAYSIRTGASLRADA